MEKLYRVCFDGIENARGWFGMYNFCLRRAHSLIGFLLGVFLIKHILMVLMVFSGAACFDFFIGLGRIFPGKLQLGMEWALVILPLLFHAIYGISIGWQAKNNAFSYRTVTNWQFTLQRWSAWVILLFLLDHVTFFGAIVPLNGIPMDYGFLQHSVQDPMYFSIYLVGMLAAIFHFFNGVTTFGMTWGIFQGPRCQKVVNAISMFLAFGAGCLVFMALLYLRYFG